LDDGRLYRFLRAFRIDVRPEEARAALSLFSYFFLITFAFWVIKTVKESYQIGVNERLWWGFELGTAVLIGFVVAINTRLLNRLPRRKYSSLTLAFFAACLVFFWFVFEQLLPRPTFPIPPVMVFAQQHANVFVFMFSFWSDIFIAMSITQFWIAVNDVLYPHQAKRLVGFLVTGGLLGGIGGSLFARVLSTLAAPHTLLLACPAVLLLTILVVNIVHAERERTRGRTEAEYHRAGRGIGYLEGLRTVRRHRYLRILAGILASAVIVGQLINFQFKFVIAAQGWSLGRRTSVLGTFFFAILLLSLVFHLATTGKVLKLFKIPLALLIAPVFLLLGIVPVFFLSVVVATAGPTLAGRYWAMSLRGADKMFDNTISQSVRELLYIPIPAQVKYRAKVFVDMFVNKLALGLGALLYWAVYSLFSFGLRDADFKVRVLGILAFLFALVWIILIWIIHGDYHEALKKDIPIIWPDAQKEMESRININWTRRYVDLIQSRQQSLALYAQNLFKIVTKEKLTADQKEAIALLAGELKARSMDSLLDVGGETFFPGIEEAITDKDIEATIHEVLALPEYRQLMDKMLGDIAGQKTASEVARMEAANLMGLMEPTPNVIHNLGRMLQDPSPDVLNYALYSAAAHRNKEHIPLIIALLGNPMIRQDAQDALTAYGPRIEDALRKRLRDRNERLEVRTAVPEVLARFGDQKAADILMLELAREEEGLEHELIDGLYKIRSNQASVHFNERTVRTAVLSLIRKNCEAYLAAEDSGPGGEPGAVGPARKAAIDLRTKRIFDLLALIFPFDDIVKAYQNVNQGTRKSLDHTLALLDNILDRELKTFLFPLIEDLEPAERVRRLRKFARSLKAQGA